MHDKPNVRERISAVLYILVFVFFLIGTAFSAFWFVLGFFSLPGFEYGSYTANIFGFLCLCFNASMAYYFRP